MRFQRGWSLKDINLEDEEKDVDNENVLNTTKSASFTDENDQVTDGNAGAESDEDNQIENNIKQPILLRNANNK
ncbi:uncharacterized protein ASCRUDRAFT_5945 [Ascoidea rubescens DSM 1968]|uniref:Uncharacterized protein n=1 Tax=Ascoidea rubescens DSM 1968 TaxID=1344418 RepID=A0A1D2VR64_9ASCO|nr:hypothetical protein ASCRUDRAFT_5945 [Ascoidea rubescens DSM 1968]ODV64065.1 hypothetical protein ASCRUDRAFT_5945 [Ascoidea rubescens DSM 1968]